MINYLQKQNILNADDSAFYKNLVAWFVYLLMFSLLFIPVAAVNEFLLGNKYKEQIILFAKIFSAVYLVFVVRFSF